jgi:hypothetical protein
MSRADGTDGTLTLSRRKAGWILAGSASSCARSHSEVRTRAHFERPASYETREANRNLGPRKAGPVAQ